MRDRGLILTGLLIFFGIITVPIWYDLSSGKNPVMPELKLPASARECVAPISYMKTSHMKLLGEWRDQAVRSGDRTFTAYNGRTYTISLTATCLQQCHEDKTAFCDRCHDYNGVKSPNCWDCHIDPKLTQKPLQQAAATQTGASNDLR
jgi:hypothetical protein